MEHIELFAFRDCVKLEELLVDDENPRYSATDGILYSKAADTLYFCPASRPAPVVVPSTVSMIYHWVFVGCKNLPFIILPASVTEIGSASFHGCSALTTLTIPASVTEVGRGLLDGCSNLKTLYCHSEIPPYCDGKLAFLICENVVLYVPVGVKVAYESAECWRDFKEIVETDFLDMITQVEDPDTDVFVVAENGAISVCNAAVSDCIEVFSMSGQCVYRGTESHIEHLPQGSYVVRIGDYTTKVVL